MESLIKKREMNKSIIIYMSPAGTTRKAAGFISEFLRVKGYMGEDPLQNCR